MAFTVRLPFLLMLTLAASLAAAEPPPVPDPFGLGERLALIDQLQDTYHLQPAAGANLDDLRAAYAQAWQRTQAAPAEGAEEGLWRLRERIARRHHVEAAAGLTEAELRGLLARLDAGRAERDASAIAALVASDRGRQADPVEAPAFVPLLEEPSAPAPAVAPPPPEVAVASAVKVRDIVFTARGVTGCVLVEEAGIGALLVGFGLDHNGAFSGLPAEMIAALRGAPGIRRAVLLLGHGTGNTISGVSLETHLKAHRVFYETLGGTAPAQRIDCLVFASCSASNPNQMLAMRDGLGYFPTWRVATAARSYATGPTVLAALRATAAHPAAPAWRGLFRLPASAGDVGCFGEVGKDGERGTTDYYRVITGKDGSWRVEDQK